MARSSLKNVVRLIESANREVPVEQSFLADLKRSIELTVKKSSRKPSMTYKPSSMNCSRNMYYQVTGAEPDDVEPSYIMIGITNSGSDIHERIQTSVSQMKENGIDCEYVDVAEFVQKRKLPYIEIKGKQGIETKLYNSYYNMSFLCDGIIKYAGKYYILEIKTETSRKFWDRKEVDRSHYNQATAYSLSLGLNNVLFVYVCRDTLDMKTYMFEVTNEMRKDLQARILYVEEYVGNGKVPPKSDLVERKTCEYCIYKSRCKYDA